MSFWDWLLGSTEPHNNMDFSPGPEVNPATGLPMAGDGIGGVDVGGSPYGLDIHQQWPSPGHDWTSSIGVSDD